MHVSVRHCIDGTYTISNVVSPYCTGTRAGIRTVIIDQSPLPEKELETLLKQQASIEIQLSLAILAEAALSFVGLGTQPPTPSWGRMLAEAQTLFVRAHHVAVFPGLAIATAVLGLNLLGDGLRDRLDPRLGERA